MTREIRLSLINDCVNFDSLRAICSMSWLFFGIFHFSFNPFQRNFSFNNEYNYARDNTDRFKREYTAAIKSTYHKGIYHNIHVIINRSKFRKFDIRNTIC